MKAAPEAKIFRNYAKYDPAKFCEDLRGVNWDGSQICSGTANENVICVNKLWLNFKSAFLKVADRNAPLIQKRVRGVDNCPWMTGSLLFTGQKIVKMGCIRRIFNEIFFFGV